MIYAKSHVVLHWLTAAALVVMVITGLGFTHDWFSARNIVVHQIAGQVLIALVAARIIARIAQPAHPQNGTHPVETYLANTVHVGLYLSLIAYLVTGYIAASGLRDPALMAPVSQAFARSPTGEWFLEAHFALKWILLALFTLHVSAALKHRFWDTDTSLSNMSLPLRKE